MSDSINSVWGHSVAFAKFPISRFSEGHSCHNFQRISIKRHGKYGSQCGIQTNAFWRSAKLKQIWHFEIFLNTGTCVAVNFKTLLFLQFSFIFQPNFMRTLTTYGNTGCFFAWHDSVEKIWRFEILIWVSM